MTTLPNPADGFNAVHGAETPSGVISAPWRELHTESTGKTRGFLAESFLLESIELQSMFG